MYHPDVFQVENPQMEEVPAGAVVSQTEQCRRAGDLWTRITNERYRNQSLSLSLHLH